MSWNDFAGFIHMGGQAAYVWGSVGAALLMMAAETAALTVRERDNEARLRAAGFIEDPEP